MKDRSTLDACIGGVSFPVDVNAILASSSGNGCPQEVVAELDTSPNWTLDSREELYCQMGDLDACRASWW
jgi:hypothetical protein